MLSCIQTILRDSEMANWLGQNCRILAFKHSWVNVAARHVEVYDEVWLKKHG